VSRESEAIDAASDESLEDQFSDIEQLELLNKAIPQLPAAYRQILLLRYFKELSLAEIAEILGISEAHAKTKLYRAVHRLRQGHSQPHVRNLSLSLSTPVDAISYFPGKICPCASKRCDALCRSLLEDMQAHANRFLADTEHAREYILVG